MPAYTQSVPPPSDTGHTLIAPHNTPSSNSVTFIQHSPETDVVDLTSSQDENEKPNVHLSNRARSQNDVLLTDSCAMVTETQDDHVTRLDHVNGKGRDSSCQSTPTFKLGKRKITERDEIWQSEKIHNTSPSHKLRRTTEEVVCTSDYTQNHKNVEPLFGETESQEIRNKEIEEEFDKLFDTPEVVFDFESHIQPGQRSSHQQPGQSSSHWQSTSEQLLSTSTGTPDTPLSRELQHSVSTTEQEDTELQKAMEASMKEQVYNYC